MPRKNGTPSPVTIEKLVVWSRGTCSMPTAGQMQKVIGLNNDSRAIGPGEVFVALSTDKDDGHRYVGSALSKGAAAALVSKKKAGMFSGEEKKKIILVDDPLKALRHIAEKYRKILAIPIIGITGSSGKTTARNFIATVLKQTMNVGETVGNWNNNIGVPLSLLRFTGSEEVGVLEMGANHEGEIHGLSVMVRPTIGVITNIGYAHIGLFGSLENIAKAKCEIVDGMSDRNAFILLNGDDRLLLKKAEQLKKTVVLFGFSAGCHVRARNERLTDTNHMCFEVDSNEYELSIPGRHFIYSALLAICLGRHFGMDDTGISSALKALRPVPLRGTIEQKSGVRFIVDCYNANPSSMHQAIGLLKNVAGKSNKVAIVGDMLELGRYSNRLHVALGKELARAGVKQVLAVGDFASLIAKGAISAGMKPGNIVTAKSSLEAVDLAKQIVRPDDVVLLKGSRGVRLETVYEGFVR